VPRRCLPLVVAVVLALVVGGACGDRGGTAASGDDPDRVSGPYGSIHTAICTATADAAAGDLEGARATFDDVHLGLHDLAAAAETEDRAVAARLLEAKQRVELRLDATTLGALVPTVAAAVRTTGGTAPDRCP
jgi:hypothetical protein